MNFPLFLASKLHSNFYSFCLNTILQNNFISIEKYALKPELKEFENVGFNKLMTSLQGISSAKIHFCQK